jgi:GNAT superfamily N-acetyltransferase
MVVIRPAREADLRAVYDVFYANEVRGAAAPPPQGDVPVDLRHILRTGTLSVAVQDGRVLAFAAAVTRGGVAFLTDLFVHPDHQSSGLGSALLGHVLPRDGRIRCTLSSTDPRALALYIRAGLQPQWPHFNLQRVDPAPVDPPPVDLTVVEAHADDPELVRWDARVSGRLRSVDHAYWLREQRAVPLWFERAGAVVGYGYVRLGAGTLWFPEACTLGPIGSATPQEVTACVLAAVGWAQQRAGVLLIDVPGPHPSLAPLLAARFQITYVETFVSSAPSPFFDARRYIASGSNLC